MFHIFTFFIIRIQKRFFSHEKESFLYFIHSITSGKEIRSLRDYYLIALTTTSAASSIS